MWLLVVSHLAFVPDVGPKPPEAAPQCLFGGAITIASAVTGQQILSASGAGYDVP